jgi:hypothetical protein
MSCLVDLGLIRKKTRLEALQSTQQVILYGRYHNVLYLYPWCKDGQASFNEKFLIVSILFVCFGLWFCSHVLNQYFIFEKLSCHINPSVAIIGGAQSQGAKGEVVSLF